MAKVVKPSGKVLLGVAGLGFGLALLSYKNCTRGCRTFAQHLIDHALGDIFGGLFGA